MNIWILYLCDMNALELSNRSVNICGSLFLALTLGLIWNSIWNSIACLCQTIDATGHFYFVIFKYWISWKVPQLEKIKFEDDHARVVDKASYRSWIKKFPTIYGIFEVLTWIRCIISVRNVQVSGHRLPAFISEHTHKHLHAHESENTNKEHGKNKYIP